MNVGVVATANRYGVPLFGKLPWRVVPNTPLGQVRGLPKLRGRLLITNGIDAYLLPSGVEAGTEDGTLQVVHLQWFEADDVADRETIAAVAHRPATAVDSPESRRAARLARWAAFINS